jgi:hypothetical protein
VNEGRSRDVHSIITLSELAAILRLARQARMVRDSNARSLARHALRRSAKALLRLADLLDAEGPLLGRSFPSNRDATCAACGGRIATGETIRWMPRTPICHSCTSGPKQNPRYDSAEGDGETVCG